MSLPGLQSQSESRPGQCKCKVLLHLDVKGRHLAQSSALQPSDDVARARCAREFLAPRRRFEAARAVAWAVVPAISAPTPASSNAPGAGTVDPEPKKPAAASMAIPWVSAQTSYASRLRRSGSRRP